MQRKNKANVIEFVLISSLALGLFLPFRAIQYDTNGIDEAQFVETHQLFQKNHLLYRPLAAATYSVAKTVGFKGSALAVLQVMNAFFGALGIGLFYLTFKRIVGDRTAVLIGTLWLATSFTYWYFSTDAGYITLAALFALAGMMAAIEESDLTAALCAALSMLTWQASIFVLPIMVAVFVRPRSDGMAVAWRRMKIGGVAIVFVAGAYATIGFSLGYRTLSELFRWVSSYGEGRNLPLWGAWGWDRVAAASVSALRSIAPVLLAAWPRDFAQHVQLGRIAVDLSLIALAVLAIIAASGLRRPAPYLLIGYILFLLFIIWWDPFEPKWFLIPNIFLAGVLSSGLAAWKGRKLVRIFAAGCVLVIAGTNFVTTVRPRHRELGPDRDMAECVALAMTPNDLFVSAEWGWSEYLGYLHGRTSVSLISESEGVVRDRIQKTQRDGGSVYMLDPDNYSETHIRWLADQTGVTFQDLENLAGDLAFSCYGKTLLRVE